MYKKLTPDKKISLIKRILSGESVTKISTEQGLSRTILYQWVRRYQSTGSNGKSQIFATTIIKRQRHWKAFDKKTENAIIKFALKNPSYSSEKIAKHFKISSNGAWRVLKRKNFNTKRQRELHLKNFGPIVVKELSFSDKLGMISHFQAGKKVSDICKEFGVSRTIFYRWLKKYNEAGGRISSLESNRPEGQRHWKFIPEAEERVIDVVIGHPDFSAQKIEKYLIAKTGKKIIGHSAIHKILKKLELNTYERRLTFATSQQKKEIEISAIEEVQVPKVLRYSFSSFLSPPLRFWISPEIKLYLVLCIISFFVSIVSITTVSEYLKVIPLWIFMGKLTAFFSLVMGIIFFIYSAKYYITIAIVLSFSRKGEQSGKGLGSLFGNIFGFSFDVTTEKVGRNGLSTDIAHTTLQEHPFVSIHVSTYNEKRVIDRLLTAVTSMEYDNYEIVVADDSNDETYELLKQWEHNPRIKISHRDTRDGYKGGALSQALRVTDPKAEYVMVFDADFIPYPDSISQFLKYIKATVGSLEEERIRESKVAAVQGYQWHVLNKSENWITRGVRSEYAGSYVMERSGTELYGGLNQISGSVYMIRRDVLEQIRWGTSITEDFELTLKLYEKGYKVLYTPYIQAPAEAVSTIKRLIRQRMRWAEGHSHNVKKMFVRLLLSPKLSSSEKFEFIYLAPYYLQAAFFIVGTAAWFFAETIFRVRLSFWTEVWGWSLVFTNLFALPLMNMVGLFMEESEEKDYLGLLSFTALSYILAPFQAYAAVKGFIEKEEGPWFRTPKTGHITDTFIPGRLSRFVKGVLGKKSHASGFSMSNNPYLAIQTAYNTFSSFHIKRRRFGRLVNSVIVILLICTMTISYSAYGVPQALAATQDYYLHTGIAPGTPAAPTSSNYMNSSVPASSAGVEMRAQRNNMNSGTLNYTWYSEILPSGADDAVLGTGQYQVNIIKNAGGPAAARIINFGIQLFVSNANGAAQNQLMANTARINIGSNGNYTALSFNIGNMTSNYNIPASNQQRVGFRIFWKNSTNDGNTFTNLAVNNSSAPFVVIMPKFQVPEIPLKVVAIPIYILTPTLPTLVRAFIERKKKKKKHIWEELADDWQWLFRNLTGYRKDYIELDV